MAGQASTGKLYSFAGWGFGFFTALFATEEPAARDRRGAAVTIPGRDFLIVTHGLPECG